MKKLLFLMTVSLMTTGIAFAGPKKEPLKGKPKPFKCCKYKSNHPSGNREVDLNSCVKNRNPNPNAKCVEGDAQLPLGPK